MNNRSAVFIASLDSGHVHYLEELESLAKENDIPVICREAQGLIKFFLTMHKPRRILEIGTAIGFSALLMSEYAPKDCEIITIERDEARIKAAESNFLKHGKTKQISLLSGDALGIIKGLTEPFDFIFMDAAKGQYLNLLSDILKLLNPGGILITDNVLQDGDILESRYAITRRDRTIHGRMRDFLYEIKHCETLCTEILDIGDGVAVSYKLSSST
ncbi:MAG: O-methyltransferase [Lachnospiraceae bacterium]|nr:O-methyltransferase [Lachnospiraceae bacterium]